MTARLSPQREAEIGARAQAATPGPWCTDSWEIYQGAEYEAGAMWIGETCRAGEMDDSRADAEFVAHARTDVPALLAELAAVRAERDEQRERALDVLNLSVENGREVCADCGMPAADGPCRAHSPDAIYQRTAQAEARLRFELGKYVGQEPTLAEEMAYLKRCLNMVLAVCTLAEATRWEQPLPVPEWVAAVRMAAGGEQLEAGEKR